MFFRCDVSTLENVKDLGEKVKSEVGNVTILVNNAGIMPCKPLEAHDEATIRKMFDINVFAHFWVSKHRHFPIDYHYNSKKIKCIF